MSLLTATDKFLAVAKELSVDLYDHSNHKLIDVPGTPNQSEKDYISDIAISYDSNHLAVITTTSKKLLIYGLPQGELEQTFNIPRSASRIRFTVDNLQILVADKSGDVLIYDLKNEESENSIIAYKLEEHDGSVSVEETNRINMFADKNINPDTEENQLESIKVLYKRKFDNVQEYQERKKQRLEKLSK
ncbi:hypothetical protein SFRURICE_009824 [Spodoptera frugiperda]|uniref:SFRICE_002290 n=1 Tax=Spodoptera frugiperda TaxID=7108 RepID=A0A2H1WP77_SPOFR|nr:hypothetical protein SFRURICE_009824 [Spodoptera frugiperda]